MDNKTEIEGEPKLNLEEENRERSMISSYSILLILTVLTGVITWIMAPIYSEIKPVKVSDIIISPVLGVLDGIEVSLFLLIFGGCMGIVNKVGAIDAGIKALIKKLEGRELVLIPVVMAIFALLGSTYGFCEETIPFYGLLGATMYMAGYDTMVSSATVLFGAGVGCLGSTVNPFAVGVAVDMLKKRGIETNSGTIILLGVILCVMAYCVSLYFILDYAKKVKKDKGSSILSLQEQNACDEEFGAKADKLKAESQTSELNKTQKVTLWLFGLTFVVMILGFIPWSDFGFDFFEAGQQTTEVTTQVTNQDIEDAWEDAGKDSTLSIKGNVDASATEDKVTHQAWSALLVGEPIGSWYFNEASTWFFVMAIVIATCAHLSEEETVDAFIDGAGELVGVALVVGLARALNLILVWSGLDIKILNDASQSLQGLSPIAFVCMAYLVYLGLSIIITSTSALATVSMPIMGPLAVSLGFRPEIVVMIFVAANGLANLFSPTSIFLPGLMMARVSYSTYLKWARKPIITIGVLSIVILTIAMMIL